MGVLPRPVTSPPRRRWIGGAIGIVVVAAVYSRWLTMPGIAPWLFPALAAVGAVLVTWSFVRVAVRGLRCYRAGGRLPVVSLSLDALLLVVFVVLPLTRLPAALTRPERGAPRVLSGFGDWLGAEGYPRVDGRHRGIDIAGRVGDPVLASADGRVVVASDDGDSCGLRVIVTHGADGYRTVYCHLSAASVQVGSDVRRGETVGAIGTSGMGPWPGYEHVHWMLQKQRHGPWEDPIAKTVGCFHPGRSYPTDGLVLTYPVRC